MSVFEQGADGKMCQVTMATAFEKANLHVQIAASLHNSTSFRYYFSCFTFLSWLLCIPRQWDENLHVSIAMMGRGSLKVMHPLDARPVYRFPASKYKAIMQMKKSWNLGLKTPVIARSAFSCVYIFHYSESLTLIIIGLIYETRHLI